MVLGRLSKVLFSDYRGPKASITEAHVIKAIISIGKAKSIGRGKLGQVLDLGQGEVRTLIRRLKDGSFIEVTSSGCTLTPLGRKQYDAIMKVIPWFGEVPGVSLDLGKTCFAILVRGRSGKVKRGLEQRDAAIKFGSSGALTIFYSQGRFKIPGEDRDCESGSSEEPWKTIRSASPKENDTVIISGGRDKLSAEYGAFSAALTLM
ncbi:MAG: DUF4443 domain-containing protein [Nitrososphaerales archaeon]